MASKRLGVGMIGGGFVGKFHIRSFESIRDADICGVLNRVDGTGEEAAALAKTLGVGVPKSFDSVADMVADPSIDVMFAVLPVALHDQEKDTPCQ